MTTPTSQIEALTAAINSLLQLQLQRDHAQNVNPSSSTTINTINRIQSIKCSHREICVHLGRRFETIPKMAVTVHSEYTEYTLVKESESLPEEMRTRLLLDNLSQPEFDRLVDHVAPADPTKMKQTDLIAILKNLFRDKTSLTRHRIEILNYRYDKAIPISEHIDRINRLASDFERSKLTDNFRVLLLLQSFCFSSDNEDLKKRALRVIEKNEKMLLSEISLQNSRLI